MSNYIIDQRLEKLEKVKANLLTLKKTQRNEELKQVNDMISRLKRWNNELKQQAIKEENKTKRCKSCNCSTENIQKECINKRKEKHAKD